jgi:hypothetical protein
MCKAYANARKVVKEFSKKDSFRKDELYEEISKKGGVLKLRAGYSIKDYLNDLEYEGLFKYYPKTKQYKRIN